MNLFKRLLGVLFFGLVAVVLLFEEWGRELLAKVFAWLARLPLWVLVEHEISTLPRWDALLVFGVPMLALLTVKLLALYFLDRGSLSCASRCLFRPKWWARPS
jgi:hypothetical protein